MNRIYNEDCLIGMERIPDKSIDMILCDLPYGTTKNKWDTVIPFEPLWKQYKRIIKENGAIVLFGQDKFTAKLMLSNEKWHRYNLIWKKSRPTGFLNANRMPLRNHEDVLVFYNKLPTYNPQYTNGKPNHVSEGKIRTSEVSNNNYGDFNQVAGVKTDKKHPKSVLEFDSMNPIDLIHPTQKNLKLIEWLVKSYTNENDLVLDNCMGSGTTAVACINTKRNFIGFELDKTYYDLANKRISEVKTWDS